MSRPSQTEGAYVQTFVRSPVFRAFMSKLLCVHLTFARSTRFPAFMSRLSCVQPIIVRSCPDIRAFNRFSCIHVPTFVHSSNLFAFIKFVRSCPHFCAFIKLGCDDPIFVPSTSDMENLFKSNTIGVGNFRCPQSLNQHLVLSIFSLCRV